MHMLTMADLSAIAFQLPLASPESSGDPFALTYKRLAGVVRSLVVDALAEGYDFDDAIDLVLEDETFLLERQQAARQLPWDLVRRMGFSKTPWIPPSVPAILQGEVKLGLRIQQELIRHTIRLEERDGLSTQELTGGPEATSGHLFTLPIAPSMRRALIAFRAGEVCTFLILADEVDLELARPACERWLKGLRSMLGLMLAVGFDSLEGVDDILLPSEYVTSRALLLEELGAQQHGTVMALNELNADAAKKGFPPYLPEVQKDE